MRELSELWLSSAGTDETAADGGSAGLRAHLFLAAELDVIVGMRPTK